MSEAVALPISVGVETTKKQIRGSSLLLVGRIIALGLNFAVQVLTVRYLSKSDYGAFAYALAMVSMGSSLVLFSLDKTVARFVPIYQENQEYDRIFGAIIVALGTVLGLSLSLILLVVGMRSVLSNALNSDPLAVALLLALIVLAPVGALDALSQGLLTIFASPGTIFFRRYVIGPGLKFGAVALTMLLAGNVFFLAAGYVLGGLLGAIVYAAMILRVLRDQGLMKRFSWQTIKMPAREILGYSAPLISTDLVFLLRSTIVILLLGYFWGTNDVAEFRAVLPIARLNLVVLQSFTFLFIPLASRLYARQDQEGINDLYWRTALWIAVLSFPIFAVTVALAQPLTLLLFGARYAGTGILLAVLSFGCYFNAALGFNSYTLRVYGRVRYILVIDVLAAIIGLGLNLLLIARYGALGAAIGASATLILHNILNHVGLLISKTGINLCQRNVFRVYATISLGGLGLFLIQSLGSPPIAVSVLLVVAVSLLLVRLNRAAFKIEHIFPELLRINLVRQLLT